MTHPTPRLMLCFLLISMMTAAARGQDGTPSKANDSTDDTRYTVITGQVFDGLGRGVNDARVVIVSTTDDTLRGEARTNSIGDFDIRLVGEHPGTFDITVVSPGFKEATQTFDIDADDLEPFVDVGLVGALTVTGRVVDAAGGAPVAGARVALETVYRTFERNTDDAGQFDIDELIPGRGRLIVDAEGFGRFTRDVEIKPLEGGSAGLNGEAVFRAALSREKILHVQVVDELARPIAGASVELQVGHGDDYRAAATDDDGSTTFKQLPGTARDLQLRLTHREFVSSGLYDHTYQFPDGSLEARHTVAMQPGATLFGRLVDGEGRAVNGARISVGADIRMAVPHTFSAIDGTYELTGLTPGPSVVTVHAVGFAPELTEVTTTARERSERPLRVRPGRIVTGTVVDAEGQPVAQAEIVAWRWREHSTLGLAALTDDAGSFALEDAPLDAFEVDIVAGNRGLLENQQVTADRTAGYRFELQPAPEPPTVSDMLCTARVGQPCPPFKLTAMDGTVYDSTRLRGSWVLLDFWATWCGPCVAELPTIRSLHGAHGQRTDFVILGISSDFDARALAGFLKQNKLPWPQIHGENSGGERLSADLGIRGIPCPILIDPEGKIASIGLAGEALKRDIADRLK